MKLDPDYDRCDGNDPACARALRAEEQVQQRTDADGTKWKKKYFGTGRHFENWHAQCVEIFGAANVEVEPVHLSGLRCIGEETPAYRIWVRVREKTKEKKERIK